MSTRDIIMKIVQQEELNFLLTNYIPRRLATRWMGWFSRIDQPLVCRASLRIWRLFTDLDLSDAEQTHFSSLHQCFTRKLKADARPIDPNPMILVSPCDAIVGARGRVVDGEALQVKGFSYLLNDLFGDADQAQKFRDGTYVTLRLTSAMYHRFHAPHDCHVSQVTHFPGDMWNVNPVTLKRVARLFCRNERAVIQTQILGSGYSVTLVPVAAILVAGIKLRFLEMERPNQPVSHRCDVSFRKGEEMGWFEHGSTIIVFAPRGFTLCDHLKDGMNIKMGQPLMHLPIN
jgi:phosphatidylserine decarboxylase